MVYIFSDCQSVCNLINGAALDLSYAGCVIDECRGYRRHFELVSFKFISRSVNKLAHEVARAACSQTGPFTCISCVPFCIEHLI